MVLMSVVYFFFFLMTRRPPRSTRTDTLFPHPPPCRSRAHDDPQCRLAAVRKPRTAVDTIRAAATTQERVFRRRHACLAAGQDRHRVLAQRLQHLAAGEVRVRPRLAAVDGEQRRDLGVDRRGHAQHLLRSEEHTSELQSLMHISYAVFCLKKKNKHITTQ